MSTRTSIPKPAVVLPKRTPVLIQPDTDQLLTNRVVGVATILLYTSAVFIAGYLTGMYRHHRAPKASFSLSDYRPLPDYHLEDDIRSVRWPRICLNARRRFLSW